MWTDASEILMEIGLQAIPGWGSIAVRTNVRTFSALGEQVPLLSKAFEATCMDGIQWSEFTTTPVVRL